LIAKPLSALSWLIQPSLEGFFHFSLSLNGDGMTMVETEEITGLIAVR
jgi:hypothetical protein